MTQVVPDQRCSARSVLAAEPMTGTAGHVHAGYLLLEEPGPWAHNAFGEGLRGEINTAADQVGIKALLIRASGRRDRAATDRRVFAATIGTRRQIVTFTVSDPAELLALDLSSYARDLREIHPDAVEVNEPLMLVCTHAKRDQCCAIRGLPLAKALVQQHPAYIFECSHLGGHRFAATALALPSGAVYGRLTKASAERAYAAERAHQVIAGDLRGMSHLPQPAQVVDAELRSRLDLPLIDDVRLIECSKQSAGTHLVRMAAAEQTWRATVRIGQSAPKPPSCGKPDSTSKVYCIEALSVEALSVEAPSSC